MNHGLRPARALETAVATGHQHRQDQLAIPTESDFTPSYRRHDRTYGANPHILVSNGVDEGVGLLWACDLHAMSQPNWIPLHFSDDNWTTFAPLSVRAATPHRARYFTCRRSVVQIQYCPLPAEA